MASSLLEEAVDKLELGQAIDEDACQHKNNAYKEKIYPPVYLLLKEFVILRKVSNDDDGDDANSNADGDDDANADFTADFNDDVDLDGDGDGGFNADFNAGFIVDDDADDDDDSKYWF
jgi:hypothetical protein